MDNVLYTIGHSQHGLEYFIDLLKKHNINYVLDVRSTPYSQYAVNYNREMIKPYLKSNNIEYFFMGTHFGARPTEKTLYSEEGYVDFDRVRKSSFFQVGMKSVLKGMEDGNRIVLMCTEKDPMECHRAIMVSRAFYDIGVDVEHILPDGNLESHDELNNKLLEMYFPDRKQLDLFAEYRSDDEYLVEAYQLQNKKIGYHVGNENTVLIG